MTAAVQTKKNIATKKPITNAKSKEAVNKFT